MDVSTRMNRQKFTLLTRPCYRICDKEIKSFAAVVNSALTLSTLGKKFSRQHFEIFFFFFFFHRRQVLTFHANCLQWKDGLIPIYLVTMAW